MSSLQQSSPWQLLLCAQSRAFEMAMQRHSLADLLGVLATAGSDYLGGRSAVFLVDGSGKTLDYCASAGLHADYIQAIQGFEIGPHSPSCGTAAYSGELVVVGDVAGDPLWSPFLALAQRHGIAACWSKPLKDSKGVVLGTYAIYHEDPRVPTHEELAAVELLAHTAALMIERSVADARLQRTVTALQRSELAARELSHRVMNTFQVLDGVLAVKLRAMSNPDARATTAEALERVRAMSLVHHKLFCQEDVSAERLDVSRFLEDLVADLAQAFASEKSLRLLVSSEEGIYLPAERCTTLGLLAVELVLNAIKHAFDDQHTDGTIAVALRRDVDTLVFSVRDNGKGLPDGGLVASKKSLGTRLIHSFVADLRAQMSIHDQAGGAEFKVTFPATA